MFILESLSDVISLRMKNILTRYVTFQVVWSIKSLSLQFATIQQIAFKVVLAYV